MKNKTVHLVNEWAAFEENHSGGSIADFCRDYLARQEGKQAENTGGLLMQLIGRISKLHNLYAQLALKDTGLNQVEEFGMLHTIKQEKNPRKSEVIYASLLELSSGTDILNRMKQRGLIREVADPEDKRSKRIMLTSEGEATMNSCLVSINQCADMLSAGLTEDEKGLAIHLLKGIEKEFFKRWQTHKNLSFEEIHKDVTETP